VSKWLPNVGAVVKVAIFVGLGALGLGALASGVPPANSFRLSEFVPRWSALTFLPVLFYNALGFELMSSAGEEMRDPQRDVPRVILLSGFVISVVYVLGVLGILLAVPLSELSLLTGTWDALEALGRRFGAAGHSLVLLLGIGFLYACVANIVTWSLGVNRVAAAAAQEGALPALLGRLHPRFKTPYMAFVIMGAVSTALLLGNALLSSNASNVFWMVFKLSGICFLVSYLLLFPAFVILRHRRPHHPRPYVMPGGPLAAWAAAGFCWLFVAGSCLLFFRPSATAPDPASAVRESWLLLAETLVTTVIGLLLMPRVLRRARRAVA
jgi:glutamate:GABA antiporter